LSNKNSYENTDVTFHGGVEYGSDIHGVSIRTNQIVWDMIKILDKNMMFGFHFSAKISTHKTVIVMTHTDINMLNKAKHLLTDFNNIPNIIILSKVKQEEKRDRLFKILLIIFILAIVLFGLFEIGLYLYNSKSFLFNQDNKRDFLLDANNTTTVKIDVKKLKALKESFDKENEPLKPEVIKALDVTTAIISDVVPPSEKAKYSSEELVKNFKGKGGVKFVLDEGNMSSKDFNATVKELNSYAMDFVKNKNLNGALKCYTKIVENRAIKGEEKANLLSKKGNLEQLMGDLNASKESYLQSLKITKELADSNFQKYVATEAFNLAKLSNITRDLNRTVEAQKDLELAENRYKQGLDRFEKLYKKNPKKYGEDLAWNYNILANFYLDDVEDLNKSIFYRKKALKLYKQLYKNNNRLFRLSLFKTYNSLGKTYMELDDIELSKKSYKKGFKVIEKGKNKRYIALSYHNLGFIYAKDREFKKADINYQKALKLYKKLDTNQTENGISYKDEIMEINYNISSLYSYRGRFKEAESRYKKIIAEYKELKNPKYRANIAKVQNSLSWIYISQDKFKNYKEAKKLLDNSIILANSIKEDNFKEYKEVLSKSYSYLAHLSLLENRLDISLLYYQKSLSLKRDYQTDKRYTTLLMAKKSYLEAFRNFEFMLEKYKAKTKQAEILMQYGKLYQSIDQQEADKKLEEALKIYTELSNKENIYSEEIKELKSLLTIEMI